MNTHAGYSKKKLDDTLVLLAGGGDKSLADFLGGIRVSSSKIQYKTADAAASWTDLVTLSTTDENVKQVDDNTNSYIPIVLRNGTGTSTITSSVRTVDTVTINPSANSLRATGSILVGSTSFTGSSTNYDGTLLQAGVVFINNTSAKNGYYVYGNAVQYGRWHVSTVGTASTDNGSGGYNSTIGYCTLILGNDKVGVSNGSGSVANNAAGILKIYAANSNFTQIFAQGNGNRSFYLPNYGGAMYAVHASNNSAVGSDSEPVYVAANGRVTACTTTFLTTNNLNYTTSGKNYKVLADSSNNLYVNVPWTDNNTDTKVTQTLTNSGNTDYRPLILGYSSSSSDSPTFSTTTNTVYASHKVYVKPSTGMLVVNGPLWLRPDGDATLKIYSGKVTDSYSDGFVKLQTSIDNSDGQTSSYPSSYSGRCALFLQPRGGAVYVCKDITAASTYADTTYKFRVGVKSWFDDTINDIRFKYVYIGNTTSWSTNFDTTIFGTTDTNYSKFTVVRTNDNAPTEITNDFSSGIAWKGADTKGIMTLKYNQPEIAFAGGNGTGLTWNIKVKGVSGDTYNLNSWKVDAVPTVSDIQNLDTQCTKNGIYYHNSSATGRPSDSYGNLINFSNVDTPTPGTNQHWIQLLDFTHDGKIWHRMRINTAAWGSWTEVGGGSHPLSIASESSATESITLSHGSKYKLTAGGSTFVFKMPSAGSSGISISNVNMSGSTAYYPILKTSGTGTMTSAYIANPSSGAKFYATSAGVYFTSDIQLKTNIQRYFVKNELTENPVRKFDWKNNDGNNVIGFIAQEVELWCPEAVNIDEYGYKSLNYNATLSALCGYLFDKVKELQNTVKELQEQINSNKC